ncbi:MAG: hypothetical protein M1818_002589 [Claussenomyces sp. TS43310]|nr:MAG: hypothetical protein M1818_002589 [Claussenomyces sp. TS43310]
MTKITYRDGIAIGEIGIYIPCLLIALWLANRHGFRRSSGWLYLIIFALCRIVGASFQLAEIDDPNNTSLLTGAMILQSVGLSPLELTALGLLSRVISSIGTHQRIMLQPAHLKLIQLVVVVGLILNIVGGVHASNELTSTGVWHPQTASKAGSALLIAAYAALVIISFITSLSISSAESGEKRLLLAVGLSLPFLLVRVVYSAISTFGTFSTFNPLTGNTTVMLVMMLIMELICVLIYQVTGISLRKQPKYDTPMGEAGSKGPAPSYGLKPSSDNAYSSYAPSVTRRS